MSLVQSKSWSAVKIARNAIQFFYRHMLNKPWDWIPRVKPLVVQPLQDILLLAEVAAIISRTRQLQSSGFCHASYSSMVGVVFELLQHMFTADSCTKVF